MSDIEEISNLEKKFKEINTYMANDLPCLTSWLKCNFRQQIQKGNMETVLVPLANFLREMDVQSKNIWFNWVSTDGK